MSVSEIPTPGPAEHESQPAPSQAEQREITQALLDDLRDRTQKPNTYFGKDVTLSKADRQALSDVVQRTETMLAPQYQTAEWQAFEKLEREGLAKGAIMNTMAMNEKRLAPAYVRDGGQGAQVKKILDPERDNSPGIEVPSRVYDTLHWHHAVRIAGNYKKRSDEGLRGTPTKPLGVVLRHLSYLNKVMDETA